MGRARGVTARASPRDKNRPRHRYIPYAPRDPRAPRATAAPAKFLRGPAPAWPHRPTAPRQSGRRRPGPPALRRRSGRVRSSPAGLTASARPRPRAPLTSPPEPPLPRAGAAESGAGSETRPRPPHRREARAGARGERPTRDPGRHAPQNGGSARGRIATRKHFSRCWFWGHPSRTRGESLWESTINVKEPTDPLLGHLSTRRPAPPPPTHPPTP